MKPGAFRQLGELRFQRQEGRALVEHRADRGVRFSRRHGEEPAERDFGVRQLALRREALVRLLDESILSALFLLRFGSDLGLKHDQLSVDRVDLRLSSFDLRATTLVLLVEFLHLRHHPGVTLPYRFPRAARTLCLDLFFELL